MQLVGELLAPGAFAAQNWGPRLHLGATIGCLPRYHSGPALHPAVDGNPNRHRLPGR